MDIPSYPSSGALSREHYALVRNVELATSDSIADQHILVEVQAVRNRLGNSGLSSLKCKSHLVLLLYCANTLSADSPIVPDLSFAFPHAVNLAEAGRTLSERRIGYLFCSELLPLGHDLQLMLVNTIRKDLESHELSRLCLAMDVLIQSPSAVVIPAVQPRLHDLLSHNSPHVRRRALFALRALARHDPDVLNSVADKARKRLRDASPSVVNAALGACGTLLYNAIITKEKFTKNLNELMRAYWRAYRLEKLDAKQLIPVFCAFYKNTLQPNQENIQAIFSLLHTPNISEALLLGSFHTLSTVPLESLMLTDGKRSPVHVLHSLLRTDVFNAHWVALECLRALDIRSWAGTDPRFPAVLDQWDVSCIMGMLEGQDTGIRRKTLKLLYSIDPALLDAYTSRLSSPLSASATSHSVLVGINNRDERARRLLELDATRAGEDGSAYARAVANTLKLVESVGAPTSPLNSPGRSRVRVVEVAVEGILVEVRDRTENFRRGCTRELMGILGNSKDGSATGPTFTVVCTALVCESVGWRMSAGQHQGLDCAHAIQLFAEALDTHPAAIQDACLLAMLRLILEVDGVPEGVSEHVKRIAERSGRHIKRRCDQFLAFLTRKDQLQTIVSSAKSPSLPDFLSALETYEASSPRTTTPALTNSSNSNASVFIESARVSTSGQAVTSPREQAPRLRYTAYEAPPAVTRPLRPSTSSPPLAGMMSRILGSASPRSPRSPRGKILTEEGMAALERTITPGELALGGGNLLELRTFGASLPETTRDDLITLDSPFTAVPVQESEPPDTPASPFRAPSRASSAASISSFKEDQSLKLTKDKSDEVRVAWASLPSFTARGWSERSVAAVIRRVRSIGHPVVTVSANSPPFEGSTKVLITRDAQDDASIDSVLEGTAVIRLTESEEDSCLWQMRCDNDGLRDQLKSILADN